MEAMHTQMSTLIAVQDYQKYNQYLIYKALLLNVLVNNHPSNFPKDLIENLDKLAMQLDTVSQKEQVEKEMKAAAESTSEVK